MATTATSIRAYLDSLSQLPGSILVRNQLAWQGLPPGNPGQILTLDDEGYPSWQAGLRWNPPLQLFDGNTGHFSGTYTSAGNQISGYLLMQRDPFTGGQVERLLTNFGPGTAGNKVRALLTIFPSDDAQTSRRNKLFLTVRDQSTAIAASLPTITEPVDGNRHLIAWAFNGDTGEAILEIDGQPDIDTASPSYSAPIIATLNKGAASEVRVGLLATNGWYGGSMGMFGMKDDYIDDFSAFPSNPDFLHRLDQTTWNEWQGIPAYWSDYASMDDHQGFAPNMLRNATVTLIPA